MEGIQHKTIAVNGINMHIAEMGQGPLVLLLHGFPELWYTWRHQILHLSSHGYHAVAPDLRGYGDTTGAPPGAAAHTSLHVVGDLVALLDALAPDNEKVFVVGHDWGAVTAWALCLYRPDRIRALVNMSVFFTRRNPARKPVESLRAGYGDDYYICRFQREREREREWREGGGEPACAITTIHHRRGPPGTGSRYQILRQISIDSKTLERGGTKSTGHTDCQARTAISSSEEDEDIIRDLLTYIFESKETKQSGSKKGKNTKEENGSQEKMVARFQEPGEIEAEFAEMGTKRVLRNFLTYRNPGPLFLPKGIGFGDSPDNPIPLPSWLSEEDLDYYTSKYEQSGFTGGLNYYRALDRNWELTAPWTGAQVKVPVKFIVGDLDLTYNAPGTKDYIQKGGFKKDVPFLQEVVVLEGVAHFLHEEKPEVINKHILDFFHKFSASSSCCVA